MIHILPLFNGLPCLCPTMSDGPASAWFSMNQFVTVTASMWYANQMCRLSGCIHTHQSVMWNCKVYCLHGFQGTEFLRGHYHSREHLFKMGKVKSPGIGGATMKQKWSCISCVTETLADIRFYHLGGYFVRRCDCHEIPLSKILKFTLGTCLMVDWKNKVAQKIKYGYSARVGFVRAPFTFTG